MMRRHETFELYFVDKKYLELLSKQGVNFWHSKYNSIELGKKIYS